MYRSDAVRHIYKLAPMQIDNMTTIQNESIKIELVIFQWLHPNLRPDKLNDKYWESMIHAEDLQIAYDHDFKSNIFFVTGQENEFYILNQFDTYLRVKEDCLKHINYEGFYLEDRVNVISQNEKNTPKVAYIENIFYHFKKERISYFLNELNHKKITKRYFSYDLEKI